MVNKKITQLNTITGANLASNDEFVVVDISADETKSLTRLELFNSIADGNLSNPTFLGTLTTEGLTLGGVAVTATASEINTLEGVTATTTELNHTIGVTSNLQTQLNAKISNANHTGDVTGASALTIANNAVTNSKAADMATARIKGRVTTGTGDPEDLTAAQARTLLNVESGATSNSADATLLARSNHTGTQAPNTIAGLTATSAELNILDGVTASTVQLNFVDGVTSAIQTQFSDATEYVNARSLVPSDYNVTPARTASQNTAALPTLITAAAGRAVDFGFDYIPVTSIPASFGNASNGFWLVTVSGVTKAHPMKSTIRSVKSTLISPLAYAAWSQNTLCSTRGERFAGVTVSSGHGNAFLHQVVTMRDRGGLGWELDWNWGPATSDIANGLGGVITAMAIDEGLDAAGGVQLSVVRDQRTSDASDETFKLYGRTLGAWLHATDIFSVTSGSALLTVPRDVLDIRLMEGDSIFIAASGGGDLTVGDFTLNGTYVCTVVNAAGISIDAAQGTSSVTSEDIGGAVQLRITEKEHTEITFMGGKTFGQSLRDRSGGDALTSEPAMVHQIVTWQPATNSGDGWVAFSGGGSNVGVARFRRYLQGSDEAQVLDVDEMPCDAALTEPSLLRVSGGTHAGKFIGTARTQSASVGFGVFTTLATADFTNDSTVTYAPTGFGTKSPWPIVQMGDYVFMTGTDNRGDDVAAGKDGFILVDVILGVALIDDVFTSGAAAFKFHVVGKSRYYDHASGAGTVEISAVGVGTCTPDIDRGTLHMMYGSGAMPSVPTQVTAGVVHAEIDVTPWVGGVPALDLAPTPSPQANMSIAVYETVGSIATGGVYKATTRALDTMPGFYDPRDGYMRPPVTCRVKVTAKAFPVSDGTPFYLKMQFSADGGSSWADYPSDDFDLTANNYMCWMDMPADSSMTITDTETYRMKAGTIYRLIVGDGSTASSTVRTGLSMEVLR